MSVVRDLISRIFYKLYKFTKPKEGTFFSPTQDDYYLISYPRSGSTWLRVMLSELLYGESGSSLKDISCFIPAIDIPIEINKLVKAEFQIVKSHDCYQANARSKNFRKIIYLVRDPRDAILSHYRFQSARGYEWDVHQFILDSLSGRIYPTSWQEHVNSWTGPGIEDKNLELKMIRYEDLVNNTTAVLKEILMFLKVNKTIEEIENAIKKSSIDKMKEKEKLGLWDTASANGMVFIGQGKIDQWKQKLSDEEVELFFEYAGIEMRRFDYN